jgi:DNA-binding SARP family transcriptional activator
MLNVNLLGGASFSAHGAVVKSDLGAAGRLLACYLFEFIGRTHRRERLADIFWGELDPDNARSALNTAIWRIRKLLELGAKGGGHRLVTIGSDIVMESGSFLQVDTHTLQNASKRVVDPRDADFTRADEQEIGAAVEAYIGPFLDGDDGDWVLQERERLHCLFVRTTLELMRVTARRGQYERALEYGRRILASDPLRESVQCDVMVLLVLNGQRAEAIHAYQRLKSVLKSDLGVDPMPDTKRLHQEILSGEIFNVLNGYTSMHFGSGSEAIRSGAACQRPLS